MSSSTIPTLRKATTCEVRDDILTRQLYATDASVYQIEPQAVAFPKTLEEAASVLRGAADLGISITCRGAGTGLAGGAVGSGLIIDFSRHLYGIADLDRERRTVRVGPGVVLDDLNAFLAPHGLWFGPDVATSSRATLGGMIANNSSGARVSFYGTTAEKTISLDMALADGSVVRADKEDAALAQQHAAVAALVEDIEDAINDRFPPGLVKRWPGYGFDRWLRDDANLTKIFAGSEGTLAGIVSAELQLDPLPERKGIGLIYFASVTEAMEATVAILDLEPVAIEHMDRVLFDQTRGQLAFASARALMELDKKPCEAILLVEFYHDIEDRLAALKKRNLGLRTQIFTGAAEMNLIWSLRKAGLSLLTGRKGSAKPIAGIEDVAVTVQRLPEYVTRLQALMEPLGIEGSFYGHASAGLLHVRPVVDLRKAEDIAKFRSLADDVSELTKEFRGSFTAEHGVGIARTEYVEEHLGPELFDAVRQVKTLFDPKNVMNPGKIIPDGLFAIDTNLRQGANTKLALPFDPVLAFAAKDGSFVGNLEQCNGCGGCRKSAPVMCPTFIATGDEIMSTRGRANTIRAALEGRLGASGRDALSLPELAEALDYCLSCKACATECPSNVNVALLKAELSHARHQVEGLSLAERAVSRVDILGRLGTVLPSLANRIIDTSLARWLTEALLGFSSKRPLPPFANQRFGRLFAKRRARASAGRGKVILWDDCFVRYYEPNVGMAAVAVLEAAGFEVVLAEERACCGRPAFSMGCLDTARKFGAKNIPVLRESDDPIIFLEPSCYSMFTGDYEELGIDGAAEVATRCHLFEDFALDLLKREPSALAFTQDKVAIAVHAHCHAKSLSGAKAGLDLARHLPNSDATYLETSCCGMAGAFGAMKKKYDLSVQVAQPLVEKINALKSGTQVAASGTSCRHQILHLTDAQPLHLAEVLASALQQED